MLKAIGKLHVVNTLVICKEYSVHFIVLQSHAILGGYKSPQHAILMQILQRFSEMHSKKPSSLACSLYQESRLALFTRGWDVDASSLDEANYLALSLMSCNLLQPQYLSARQAKRHHPQEMSRQFKLY